MKFMVGMNEFIAHGHGSVPIVIKKIDCLKQYKYVIKYR